MNYVEKLQLQGSFKETIELIEIKFSKLTPK